MVGEVIKNVSGVLSALLACLCYCHLISSRLPKGNWRLISLVPIFYIFSILPLYTTTAIFAFATSISITWLANFKLLLFAFNQGPLAFISKINLPTFIVMTSLPFKITLENAHKKSKKSLPLSEATELPILVILLALVLMHEHKDYNQPYILMALNCLFIFFIINISMWLSSLLVHAFSGLEMEPPSDQPYLATSLQDFWGRRWNLPVNDILRQTVYRPIRSATVGVLGRGWAEMSAMLTTFLVSGLMHELFLWHITRSSPSWEMTMYFVVQGVGVVVEYGLKVALGKKNWRLLPCFVSRLLAVGFVVGTSFWLLWPPVIRSGADANVYEEVRFLMVEVPKKLYGILVAYKPQSWA